ncbi:MAG: tyrosine-type recombinase/integrase [Patescibacteria group bacterium]|mgnify:CR=1 FL=1
MPETQSLPELISEFVSFLNTQHKSTYTIVAYRKDLTQLAEFLARSQKVEAQEASTVDIESFLRELEEKHYTPKSIARKLNAIKGFFRWLRQRKIIEGDPALAVPHPKYEMAAPRVLSVLEYRALRDAARGDLRTAAIIEILLQTGMRISELANLNLDDIKKNEVKVAGRTVPLNTAARHAIDDYLKVRYPTQSPHLFVTKTGRPLLVRNIRAVIERCFAQSGIEEATVNDLRNTFIVQQLARGVDLLTISRIVGHKRLSTTERYLSLLSEQKKGKPKPLGEL